MSPLARTLQALLFVSSEPVPVAELCRAADAWEDNVIEALAELGAALEGHGLVLQEVGGGWTLATVPEAEDAARRLLAAPRPSALTPAQAEALAVVAYLQPVSRPEIARIRGVASDTATGALVERGLVEEAGRSQFGAVLYRTTPGFLRAFGLGAVEDLPDPGRWDPSPEEEGELRERLLKAGEQRANSIASTA